MKNTVKVILFLILPLSSVFGQSGSIGIGIESPNPNAVLHLASENDDQGLLVPRFTSEQRNDSTFMASLDSVENGLLIFDIDDNLFYFWSDSLWEALSVTVVTQNLSFDELTLQLSISDGNTISLVDFASMLDSDSTNELQTISFANDTLFLSDGGGAVVIDTSSSNEIQDLELVGNELSITNNPSATPIDISVFSTNTDEQTLTFTDSTSSLYISNGDSVDLSPILAGTITDNDSTNEIQDIQLSGELLSLTNNATATEIDLSATDNQTLDLTGSSLSIEDGNSVDLTSFEPLWSQIGTTVFYDSGDVRIENRFITTPASSAIQINSAGVTISTTNSSNRIIRVIAFGGTSGRSIANISAGQDGQELIIVGEQGGSTSVEVTTGGNIRLGSTSRFLSDDDVLSLMYISNLGQWVETSYVDINEIIIFQSGNDEGESN